MTNKITLHTNDEFIKSAEKKKQIYVIIYLFDG